jgi:hypothetical protein
MSRGQTKKEGHARDDINERRTEDKGRTILGSDIGQERREGTKMRLFINVHGRMNLNPL